MLRNADSSLNELKACELTMSMMRVSSDKRGDHNERTMLDAKRYSLIHYHIIIMICCVCFLFTRVDMIILILIVIILPIFFVFMENLKMQKFVEYTLRIKIYKIYRIKYCL